jgi:hypothetical protein
LCPTLLGRPSRIAATWLGESASILPCSPVLLYFLGLKGQEGSRPSAVHRIRDTTVAWWSVSQPLPRCCTRVVADAAAVAELTRMPSMRLTAISGTLNVGACALCWFARGPQVSGVQRDCCNRGTVCGILGGICPKSVYHWGTRQRSPATCRQRTASARRPSRCPPCKQLHCV